MASTTPNLGLNKWDSPSDGYIPGDLSGNWDKIDAAHAPSVAPGQQIVYSALATNQTTVNTADPGAVLNSFSAASFTAVPHFFHIMIPRLAHSVGSGTVRFRLKEGGTDLVGIVGAQCSATAGVNVNLSILAPFTPTVGTHSYVVSWWTTTAGTLTIGSTGFSPAILRIIKA